LGDFEGIFDENRHSSSDIVEGLAESLRESVEENPGIGFAKARRGRYQGQMRPTTKAVLILYISQSLKEEIDAWRNDSTHEINITEMDVLPVSFAPRFVEETEELPEPSSTATTVSSDSTLEVEGETSSGSDGETDDAPINAKS
jgi:hypothetical protein